MPLFQYTTGNLLRSSAGALVNTVNCEGFMGKGIAYQFKQQYPETFIDYEKACQMGTLRPGKLHTFREGGKLIVNFPTKDRWRNPSRMEYIESGLDELAQLICTKDIKSIAIPPLGCGNGGLAWPEVRKVIEQRLSGVPQDREIILYEPSAPCAERNAQEPKLREPALVLMELKEHLNAFSRVRLQMTAYFVNVFSHSPYFKFAKNKSGLYSHTVAEICKSIKAYQDFHAVSTAEAKVILYRKLASKSVDASLSKLRPSIQKAADFANLFPDDHELERLAAVCFLIEKGNTLAEPVIVRSFLDWPEDEAKHFWTAEISNAIQTLYDHGIVDRNMEGYYLL